jgi:hypothetical protein
MKSNCLWYALDKWHDEGGGLILAKSVHWLIPHVLHETIYGELSHFVPPGDLKEPWYSLFGFEGVVMYVDKDKLNRNPMSKLGMFLGTCILFTLGGAWAVHSWYKRYKFWA